MEGEAAGIGNATSGSATDKLTREHKMTLDEAQLILNVKRDTPMEDIIKRYEALFKQNSPPPPPEPGSAAATSKKTATPAWSHYLQSKVVRARERLEAETKVAEEDAGTKDGNKQGSKFPLRVTESLERRRRQLMGVLVGALGALGAMLVPGAIGRGVETHSLIVAAAVVAVILILAYVTNPSAASFRTFLTELALRRHLSKLHDASEADPPALTWARHSHQIDAAPHLQFATRASVSVRSSAHIFRSFGILTIAAVTPVADHRNKPDPDVQGPNSFASDQGRWFLGAFGKWWLGGALLLGKADEGHANAGLLDIRLLDDSELSKWTIIPDNNSRRTPPPLPRHASLPLHAPTKQPSQKPSKPKSKSKSKSKSIASGNASESIPPVSNAGNSNNTANIDTHPLLAELLQHIATTQTMLSNARAQLAQLHAATAHTRSQTEEHAAQRAKHNSASTTSDAAKTHTQQLTSARRTLRASQKTLASVQSTHAALEQRAHNLSEEAKSLQERVLRDQERLKEGEEKGRAKREVIAEVILSRKEELRRVEEEIMGCSGDKEVVSLVGKVRALEAEVKEARKTLEELKASQASVNEELMKAAQEREQEQEKEPGVVYIGQTPVRAIGNAGQSNPQRIYNLVPSHVRAASGPLGMPNGHPTSSYSTNLGTTMPPTVSPSSTTNIADAASPARSARSKGYAIFDTDLANLGGPKLPGLSAKKSTSVPTMARPLNKGAPGAPGPGVATISGMNAPAPIVKDLNLNQPPPNPNPGSATLASTRSAFSPFDSDTMPIPIPKRGIAGFTLNPDNAKYSPVVNTKFSLLPDGHAFGIGMESPSAGAFSPPPTALLPSSLLSEDGQRWDGAESPTFANGSSPVHLIGENGVNAGQFGNGQWANGTSPGQYLNGASPPRWEKDADGWVTEARPALNGWENNASAGNWDNKHSNGFTAKDANQARDGWVGDSDGWAGENNGWASEGRRRWASESTAGAGAWAPHAEGRPRSLSVESRFDISTGRPRSNSHDAHRLSTGADSGYHTATGHSSVSAPKKRSSGSSSGDDVAQDTSAAGLSFAPPFLQHSPVSGPLDTPTSSFGSGIFGLPGHISTRRGFDAQRVSLPARVPQIREVEEPEHAPTPEPVATTTPAKGRRWFPSVGGAKKDSETSTRVQKSELNPDAKVFSFSPDTSKIFNFTRGRTFNMAPPAAPPAPAEPTTVFSPFGLGGSANSSTPALGNGSVSSATSGTFFSSLLAFAPSPAEREALQRALGPNGLTRTLSGTSARSPFTSPLPSARSSTVDLSDKAAFPWNESAAPVAQKRTWFPVRKKAAVEEAE